MVLLVGGVDLDVLCRFVFVGWVFNGCVLGVGLLGGIVNGLFCFGVGGLY